MTREEVISLMRSHIRVEPVLPEMEADERLNRRNQEIEINTFRLFYTQQGPRLSADVANRLASDFIDEHIKERVQRLRRHARSSSRRSSSGCRARSARSRSGSPSVKNENAGRLPEDLTSNQRMLERALDSLRGRAATSRSPRATAPSTRSRRSWPRARTGARIRRCTPQRKLDLVRAEPRRVPRRADTPRSTRT